MPRFSIIIPVRTINDYVKEGISKIKLLDFTDFEVFIITDRMEDFDCEDKRFNILSSGEKGPGEKRNLGVRKSTGEILVFLDDDSYPRKDWLSNAIKVFEGKDIYALGGPAITPLDAGYRERLSGRVLESVLVSGNTTYRYLPGKKRVVMDYPSVNLFIRRESFNSVGGFPIDFWPGEDTKLCLDLVKKNGKGFLYDPSVLVYHHRRNLLLPHLKQVSRYGRHRGQFAKIFPETSRLPSYFIPSIFVLGLFLGPFICTFLPFLWTFYSLAVSLYLILLLTESLRVAIKEKSLSAMADFAIGVFMTHVVYGINFIIGLIRKPELQLKKYDEKTGNYIEG